MGGLLIAPAKQRVTMTAMYANYIKTPLYVHAAETIHSTFIELGSTQPTQLYFERNTHEYIVVLANGCHFKGHTHCYLGMVPKAFVKAGNPDSACYYRYCWNVGIYSANQTTE